MVRLPKEQNTHPLYSISRPIYRIWPLLRHNHRLWRRRNLRNQQKNPSSSRARPLACKQKKTLPSGSRKERKTGPLGRTWKLNSNSSRSGREKSQKSPKGRIFVGSLQKIRNAALATNARTSTRLPTCLCPTPRFRSSTASRLPYLKDTKMTLQTTNLSTKNLFKGTFTSMRITRFLTSSCG